LVLGSIRVTTPSPELVTQTDPRATMTACDFGLTGMCATTLPLTGSRRASTAESLSWPFVMNHMLPCSDPDRSLRIPGNVDSKDAHDPVLARIDLRDRTILGVGNPHRP
jgi:hypothetical protein